MEMNCYYKPINRYIGYYKALNGRKVSPMMEIKKENLSIVKNSMKAEVPDVPDFLKPDDTDSAHRILKSLDEYAETPLVELKGMAEKSGLKDIFVKDESKRFGLNAFKGLGGLYAITTVITRELGLDPDKVTFDQLKRPEYADRIRQMVFVTATDGNHGRGIAWAAGKLGCKAYVYMPKGSTETRAQAIRNVNDKAEVQILDVNYDDAVRYANRMAEKHGWYMIQDTSWEGYEDVPKFIIQGYTTMAEEACRQLDSLRLKPTHVLIQAGVGALATGVAAVVADHFAKNLPKLIVVEPENNACIYQSIKKNDGKPHIAINQDFTIMAGLNCGEPCTIGWPLLRSFASWTIKCRDEVSEFGMQILAKGIDGDSRIVSGESGAVTAGALYLICNDENCKDIKELLHLDENSVVLCFSTEGDTDPEVYSRILSKEISEIA